MDTTALMTFASAALGVLLLSTVPGVARAASEPRVRLLVSSGAGCASQVDLAERVAARSPRIRFVDEADALQIRAKFTVLSTGNVLGEVVLAKPGESATSRQLVARSCAQAADAVALIIAVTLDPEALDRERTTPGRDDATARDEARERPVEAPAEPVPNGEAQPETPMKQIDAGAAAPSDGIPTAPRARFGAHVTGLAVLGPAPGLMPGVGLSLIAGIDRDAPWSPALVLGFGHAVRAGVEAPGGTASFTLSAVSLDACPVRIALSAIEARPCGSVLGGRLTARGTDTNDPPGTVARPFLLAGAAGVLTLRLAPRLELLGRFGAGVTLIRDSFEFVPVVFHEAAPFTAFASLGIGLRSP